MAERYMIMAHSKPKLISLKYYLAYVKARLN
jgi:hypothetical protein